MGGAWGRMVGGRAGAVYVETKAARPEFSLHFTPTLSFPLSPPLYQVRTWCAHSPLPKWPHVCLIFSSFCLSLSPSIKGGSETASVAPIPSFIQPDQRSQRLVPSQTITPWAPTAYARVGVGSFDASYYTPNTTGFQTYLTFVPHNI